MVKMRYWKTYPAIETLKNSGLPQKAEVFLKNSSSEDLKLFVKKISEMDAGNNYMLISYCLELNADEVKLLMEAAIEEAKDKAQES
jgi:hypothetical protein